MSFAEGILTLAKSSYIDTGLRNVLVELERRERYRVMPHMYTSDLRTILLTWLTILMEN